MSRWARGQLFKLGAVSSVGLAGLAIGSVPAQSHTTWSWNNGKETFHFIGYLHGSVGKTNKLVYSPDPTKEFPEPVDAIFAEDASRYLDDQLMNSAWQALSEGKADDAIGTGLMVKYCRNNNIPFFLGDLSPKYRNVRLLESSESVVPVLEMLGGGILTFEVALGQNSTRRQLIVGGLGLGVTAWGASNPAVDLYDSKAGAQNLQDSATRQKRDFETAIHNLAHPEMYLSLMRNSLWAKKLLYIGDELHSRGLEHPRIGIVGGLSITKQVHLYDAARTYFIRNY